MGGRGDLIEEGGFKVTRFHMVDTVKVETVGEIKIIRKNNLSAGLPMMSNTSSIYIGTDHKGNPNQIRFYKDREPVSEFNLKHGNMGAHFHDFADGNRLKTHRPPTAEEKAVVESIFQKLGITIKWHTF